MPIVDRALGLLLAAGSLLIIWTARAFPAVPGQKVGAGFLPILVGAALFICAVLLVVRSFRAGAQTNAPPARSPQRWPLAVVVLAAVLAYIFLAERLGFLLVAPVLLLVLMRAFGVNWGGALLWSIGGSAVVHAAFYKLLKVPLPWGVLRPFY